MIQRQLPRGNFYANKILQGIGVEAARRAGANAKVAPQLLMGHIMFALVDAVQDGRLILPQEKEPLSWDQTWDKFDEDKGMSNVGVTEEELVAKATGPRVTKEEMEANIAGYVIFNGADAVKGDVPYNPNLELLTLCLLTTLNGFTVVGQSACAWPANYDKDIGDRLALEDAKGKLWALMGYHLKQQIYEGIVPLTEPTWEDRLQNEKAELEERYTKLCEFIDGPLYQALPERDRRLLDQQKEAQSTLLNILVSRLIGIS